MSEWKEFSKEKPNYKYGDPFWLSNGKEKKVLFLGVDQYVNNLRDEGWIYWMLIEEPELPKQKLHDCYSTKVPHLSCYETLHGELLIDLQGITEKAFSCPFCGYSPIKD